MGSDSPLTRPTRCLRVPRAVELTPGQHFGSIVLMAIAKVCNVDERSNALPQAIQFASERTPGIWIWHVQVNISPARRSAAFKAKHGPEKLAKAYAAMNLRLTEAQRPHP